MDSLCRKKNNLAKALKISNNYPHKIFKSSGKIRAVLVPNKVGQSK